ncbi:MAG: hypothetical protein ABIT05_01420 [Chitinophagaceae bacterium]
MTTIDFYRVYSDPGGLFQLSIKPDSTSVQVKKIMGENQLTISFEDSRYIDFKLRDFCVVFGEKYQLNRLPVIDKVSTYLFKYEMVLQAESADLAKMQFLFLGSDNSLKESDFSLMGNAETFIDLILANMARLGYDWIKGEILSTPYKNLSFSAENCYNALSRLATEFDTEFWIIGRTIHLVKKRTDTGFVFRHGRFRGAYEIIRQNLDNSDVVTRLYAFGAEKNLPQGYPGIRLRLPGFYPYAITNLTVIITATGGGNSDYEFTFDPPGTTGVTGIDIEYRIAGSTGAWTTDAGAATSPRTINLPTGSYEFRFMTIGGVANGVRSDVVTVTTDISSPVLLPVSYPYLEKNIALYGLLEATQLFDDIYPHRTGTISSVNAIDFYKFIDTSMNFDINAFLLPGMTAKVVFNTGQLAGYSFEVSAYNNGTKEFTILKNKDEATLEIPSASLKPAIGDKYVLVDIRMPQSYVETAEELLKTKATELLEQISQPQVGYQMILDPVYLRDRNRTIDIGNEVWISDTQFAINRKYRVVSTTRNLVSEFSYSAELSDKVQPGTMQRIMNSLDSSERNITDNAQQLANNQLINGIQIGNLKIQQGTLILVDVPTTSTDVGFSQLRIEDATNKIFKRL